MGMWVEVTWVSPNFLRLAMRASAEVALPSSDEMTMRGWAASLGASEGMSQAGAFAMSSRARVSGVVPASGDMPSAARFLATGAMA